HVPAGQHGGDAGLDAADARHVDVFRTHGAAARPDDQIFDLVFIGIDVPLTPAMTAADADLVAFRFLRLEVRVTFHAPCKRVIQIVEGRRAVGGAIGGGQRQRVAQVEAVTQASGVVRTEELILVATQAGLHAVAAESGLVLDEVALVVAVVLGIVVAAVDTILFVIHAEAQHLRLAEIEVVLPAQAVAAGIEARIEVAVLKSVIQVLAMPGLQGDVPEGQRREARATAERLQGAVAVCIGSTESVFGAIATGIKVAVVFALQPAAVELQAVVEAIAGAQLCREFAVAVGIRLEGLGFVAAIGASIDTVGGLAGHAEVEPAVAVTAGHTGRPTVARTRTGTHREVRLEALGATATGEDLNHPAHGLRTVQAGTRPTDDLDTLDLLHRDALQRGAAGGGRADPDAVDQHQHVLVAGAANGHRGALAAPAVAGDADSGQALQQLRHAAGLLAFDLVTGDEAAGSDGHRRMAGPA